MSETRELLPVEETVSPFFVGIDLGGTNIKFGVVDDRGRTLAWHRIRTEVGKGPEDAAERMGTAVHKVIQDAGLEPDDIARVGLGSAGTMDLPAGKLMVPANLPGWNYFPIRDRVGFHCGLPVTFANDGSAAAYAEYWIGSGRNLESLILLTLGTGIGCGIIMGDFILDGQHSHGGEYGHTIIDCNKDARICGCGQPGHFEAYGSASAVIKRTQEALDQGKASSLAQRIEEGATLTPKLVAKEAEAGDALSLEIILETARYLGIGITNLMHTIDPNGILIGGAMTFGGHETELGRRFLQEIQSEVKRRAYAVLAENTLIDYATLGGDAGYIGAAGIARLECTNN